MELSIDDNVLERQVAFVIKKWDLVPWEQLRVKRSRLMSTENVIAVIIQDGGCNNSFLRIIQKPCSKMGDLLSILLATSLE